MENKQKAIWKKCGGRGVGVNQMFCPQVPMTYFAHFVHYPLFLIQIFKYYITKRVYRYDI